LAEQPLDDEGEAEGEQQPVEMIELVHPAQEGALEENAERADDDRRDDQRRPIADAEPVEQEPGAERAHHVLRAMGEVDDVEKPEDDRQAEAQHGVERAVDEPEQKLAEQRLRRNSEQLEHHASPMAGNPISPS